MQEIFQNNQKIFYDGTVLTDWTTNAQIIFEADASDYSLAAILSIFSPNDSNIHLIAFRS